MNAEEQLQDQALQHGARGLREAAAILPAADAVAQSLERMADILLGLRERAL